MAIDAQALATAQYWGDACVHCGKWFNRDRPPIEVGWTGSPWHALHACPGCVTGDEARPAWPAVGSA